MAEKKRQTDYILGIKRKPTAVHGKEDEKVDRKPGEVRPLATTEENVLIASNDSPAYQFEDTDVSLEDLDENDENIFMPPSHTEATITEEVTDSDVHEIIEAQVTPPVHEQQIPDHQTDGTSGNETRNNPPHLDPSECTQLCEHGKSRVYFIKAALVSLILLVAIIMLYCYKKQLCK